MLHCESLTFALDTCNVSALCTKTVYQILAKSRNLRQS